MKHKGKPIKEKAKAKTKPLDSTEFLSWYEIPALNLDRAIHFYSSVFNIEFETVHTPSHTMAFFPEKLGIGGAIVIGDGSIPSQTGSLLYLNAGKNLDESLLKVSSSGGHVLMGTTLISEKIGYYSLVLDSEGNRLALYSKP